FSTRVAPDPFVPAHPRLREDRRGNTACSSVLVRTEPLSSRRRRGPIRPVLAMWHGLQVRKHGGYGSPPVRIGLLRIEKPAMPHAIRSTGGWALRACKPMA